MENNIYVNKHDSAFVNTNKQFVYEVCVYCHYKNYYSIMNRVYYQSNVEISKYVRSFFINPHAEISCTLYSAPLPWLLDKGYTKYQKPDKKSTNKVKVIENVKPQITVTRRRNSKTDG